MSNLPWWDAPTSTSPISAEVKLPGSKSQTNRALFLGAIVASPLAIRDALSSRDSVLAVRALEQLGVTFSSVSDDILVAHPPKQLQLSGTIDCGLAGTVMRFVPAIAAFGHGSVKFDGDPESYTRPVGPLLDALEQLGAGIEYHGEPGFMPFTLTGIGDKLADVPERIVVDSSDSSQYLSALLLAAPLAPRTLTIEVRGNVPSAAHIEMTTAMLEEQGVKISRTRAGAYLVAAGRPAPTPVQIEPDLSNAGPFLAAAVIAGGTVTVPDWPANTTQAGDAWKMILPQFGAQVVQHGTKLQVSAPGYRPGNSWAGVDLDLSRVGELTPTITALCLLAQSPSQLRGIAHLRGHETDRLRALVTEIERAGGRAEETPDGLIITPQPLHSADFDSYHDHRMAIFGALVGLAVPGCRVQNIATTDKTLPEFPQRWDAMLRGEASPALPSLARAIGMNS